MCLLSNTNVLINVFLWKLEKLTNKNITKQNVAANQHLEIQK